MLIKNYKSVGGGCSHIARSSSQREVASPAIHRVRVILLLSQWVASGMGGRRSGHAAKRVARPCRRGPVRSGVSRAGCMNQVAKPLLQQPQRGAILQPWRCFQLAHMSPASSQLTRCPPAAAAAAATRVSPFRGEKSGSRLRTVRVRSGWGIDTV
jgi:hypothetical protein